MTTTLVNHSKSAADIVAHAVTSTRAAAPAWAAAKRQPHLLSWKRLIHSRSDELIDLVCAETGKSHVDATVEVTLALEHLDWATRNASRVMSEQRVHRRLLAFNQSAVIRRQPFGVVGVIGPWNYPVFTPMGSISYALATGNAVVFKPSEYTPRTGQWLAHTFAEAVPQHKAFEFVIGDGRTGQCLCEAEIDKLAFTGSGPTGRKVMAACAERLVPVVMELGGKDAAIIADDADLVAAARSASRASGPEIIPTSTRSTPVSLSSPAMVAASAGPNSTPAMCAVSRSVASEILGSSRRGRSGNCSASVTLPHPSHIVCCPRPGLVGPFRAVANETRASHSAEQPLRGQELSRNVGKYPKSSDHVKVQRCSMVEQLEFGFGPTGGGCVCARGWDVM